MVNENNSSHENQVVASTAEIINSMMEKQNCFSNDSRKATGQICEAIADIKKALYIGKREK